MFIEHCLVLAEEKPTVELERDLEGFAALLDGLHRAVELRGRRGVLLLPLGDILLPPGQITERVGAGRGSIRAGYGGHDQLVTNEGRT
jgi:hypothetical protein